MKDNEFIELALCHIDQMYRLAYARVGNEQDAEDLVQEAYLRAYRAYQTLRSESISPASDLASTKFIHIRFG